MARDTLTAQQSYQKSPRGRFTAHRRHSKARGIPFNLTFEEWWILWEPYWESRGRGNSDLVMCRIGDKGAYEVGNVFIGTGQKNRCDAGFYDSRKGKDSHNFKDVDEVVIINQILEGHTYRQVAKTHNVSTRVIQRVLDKAREVGDTRLPPRKSFNRKSRS